MIKEVEYDEFFNLFLEMIPSKITDKHAAAVAVKTVCCDKVVGYEIPEQHVKNYITHGKGFVIREIHCKETKEEKSETPSIVKYCSFCKVVLEGENEKNCRVCGNSEFLEFDVSSNPTEFENNPKNITKITEHHLKNLCLKVSPEFAAKLALEIKETPENRLYPGIYASTTWKKTESPINKSLETIYNKISS